MEEYQYSLFKNPFFNLHYYDICDWRTLLKFQHHKPGSFENIDGWSSGIVEFTENDYLRRAFLDQYKAKEASEHYPRIQALRTGLKIGKKHSVQLLSCGHLTENHVTMSSINPFGLKGMENICLEIGVLPQGVGSIKIVGHHQNVYLDLDLRSKFKNGFKHWPCPHAYIASDKVGSHFSAFRTFGTELAPTVVNFLSRMFHGDEYDIDVGGDIVINHVVPSNASGAMRYTRWNKETKKPRYQGTYKANVLNYHELSLTSCLSEQLSATARFSMALTSFASETSIGVSYYPEDTPFVKQVKARYNSNSGSAIQLRMGFQEHVKVFFTMEFPFSHEWNMSTGIQVEL